jgi:DNA-binding FrmR family transcriptional regulator
VTTHEERTHDRLRRLRRIEGQVRGLQRMVEDGSDVLDVLTQVSAATHALQAFSLGLVEEHLAGCVDAATAGGTVADDKLHEATVAVSRLLRS